MELAGFPALPMLDRSLNVKYQVVLATGKGCDRRSRVDPRANPGTKSLLQSRRTLCPAGKVLSTYLSPCCLAYFSRLFCLSSLRACLFKRLTSSVDPSKSLSSISACFFIARNSDRCAVRAQHEKLPRAKAGHTITYLLNRHSSGRIDIIGRFLTII